MELEKRPENPEEIRRLVRDGYTQVAERRPSCCGGADPTAVSSSKKIGYSDQQLGSIPAEANLGVGCGNPTAIAGLTTGQVVLDLGSGAGMDAFLAARQVGPTGRVIGVDMTDAMLAKARDNARKGGFANVEFRKGTIEQLPLADETVDVILSNCVINLSPEKDRVFREAYRVLRRGGRLMISDIVLEKALPPQIEEALDAYVGCVGGATLRDAYLAAVRDAGFQEIRIERESNYGNTISLDNPLARDAITRYGFTPQQVQDVLSSITSVHVSARK